MEIFIAAPSVEKFDPRRVREDSRRGKDSELRTGRGAHGSARNDPLPLQQRVGNVPVNAAA
jgi:hypothetical protein